MNSRRKHPSLDQWMGWLDRTPSDPQLHDHLQSCDECRWMVHTLRESRDALSGGRWTDPPQGLVDDAVSVGGSPRPPVAKNPVKVDWHIADVRGGGSALAADEAQIMAGSCESGEASVLVRPPLEDSAWHFEVRAWMATPGDDDVIHLVLALEDHVVHAETAAEGTTVRFAEIVSTGWKLEVHFPDASTLVFEDPFGAD